MEWLTGSIYRHDLENLEILFFSSRVAKGEALHLPVAAEFHLPKAG